MNVRNCKLCGRIFNYVVGPIYCPACKEGMEAKFQEVKEYVREHRGVSMTEVAEACDVEVAQIRQWLREDRLEVTQDSALFLNCEKCGKAIRSGRFCEKCKNEVTQGFKDIISSSRPVEQPKMRKDNTDASAKMRFL